MFLQLQTYMATPLRLLTRKGSNPHPPSSLTGQSLPPLGISTNDVASLVHPRYCRQTKLFALEPFVPAPEESPMPTAAGSFCTRCLYNFSAMTWMVQPLERLFLSPNPLPFPTQHQGWLLGILQAGQEQPPLVSSSNIVVVGKHTLSHLVCLVMAPPCVRLQLFH